MHDPGIDRGGVQLGREAQVPRAALRGTYEERSPLGGGATLTFADDGSFVRREAAPAQAERGRYRVDGNVLELDAEGGGAPRRHWMCSSSPEQYLFIDGGLWIRRGR